MNWKDGTNIQDGEYLATVIDGEVVALSAIGDPHEVEGNDPVQPEPPVTNLIRSWSAIQNDGHVSVTADAAIAEGFELRMHCSPNTMPTAGDKPTAALVEGVYTTKSQFAPGTAMNVWLYWKNTVTGEYTLADGPKVVRIPDVEDPEPTKPPAEPVKAIATAAELRAAVKAARDTTLRLAPGNFGTLDLDGIKTAGLVIDGGRVAQFNGINAKGTEGVTVSRATIQGEGRRFNVNLDHVRDFGLSHLTVVGGWTGVKCFVGENLKYDHIYVDRTEEDCFKFANINGADLANLSSSGMVHPSGTAHPDLIQFQGDSADVTLRRVLFIARNSERLQLGWFQDGTRHDNLVVEDFLGFSGKLNALHVDQGDNVQIRRVTMLTVPDRGHDQALIVAPSGAVVENCIWTVSRNPGQRGSNLAIALDQYPELFPGAMKGLGATLADLEPKGAAIGRGAYDYWRELTGKGAQ